MKKVFNKVSEVARLFVLQKQDEAMTPLCNIEGRGKGRRFYFKGDTAYSYGDHFPLAKIKNGILLVRDFCPSITTKKHRYEITSNYPSNYILYSDDLENPVCIDYKLHEYLKKLMGARSRRKIIRYKMGLQNDMNLKTYPITKSKFPLLFDEKYEKVRNMFFSNDMEAFNLAKKIIKQNKLVK